MPTHSELVQRFANGAIILAVDSMDTDNRASMVVAAQAVDAGTLGFMQRFGSGIICVSLTEERLDELDLPLVAGWQAEEGRPAFAHSVDLLKGTTTGISASDRALTIRALVDPSTRPGDLARPGHVYPIRYQRMRPDRPQHHADFALDLATQADLYSSGVATALMNDDGSLADFDQTLCFARLHGLLVADAGGIRSPGHSVLFRRVREDPA